MRKIITSAPEKTQSVARTDKNTSRKDIQGLRALSVLAVILFHANKNWVPGGFIGVDIFFVISGFIVTSIILKEKANNTFSFITFYLNRFRRIVPAYFFMLAVIAIIMAVLLTPHDFIFFKGSLKSALYFGSNQYFAAFGDYFAPMAHELPLLHTWSLAVEMQFYLILPVLIILLPTRYLKKIFPLLIIFLTTYLFYSKGRGAGYYALTSRISEFLIGASVVLIKPEKNWPPLFSITLGWIGALLVILSLFLINDSVVFPGIIALIPCIGIALIIAAPKSRIAHIMSMPLLVEIGNLSYSLYLWHWPFLVCIRYYTGNYELSTFCLIIFFLFTLASAYLSYRYIENPFRKQPLLNTKIYYLKQLTIFSIIILSTLIIPPLINTSIIPPLPVEYTRYAAAQKICHGKINGDCYQGAAQGKKEILVLGDSHAAQLNHFFDAVGKENKFRARIITASSCITIPKFDFQRLPRYAQAPCKSQIAIAKKFTQNTNLIVLAGLWQYHINSKKFINALDEFLQDANNQNKKIILMGQIPVFSTNISRMHRFQNLGLPVHIVKNNEWIDANEKIAEIASKHPSTIFFNFSDNDFFSKAPFYNETLIYFDKNHLNEIGAANYGKAVSSYFTKHRLYTMHTKLS